MKQTDVDGSVTYSEPVRVGRRVPDSPRLRAAYPNPASGQITVEYVLPGRPGRRPRLRLYDTLGRAVRALPVRGLTARGGGARRTRTVDVSGLSSGTYVLELRQGEATATETISVVR